MDYKILEALRDALVLLLEVSHTCLLITGILCHCGLVLHWAMHDVLHHLLQARSQLEGEVALTSTVNNDLRKCLRLLRTRCVDCNCRQLRCAASTCCCYGSRLNKACSIRLQEPPGATNTAAECRWSVSGDTAAASTIYSTTGTKTDAWPRQGGQHRGLQQSRKAVSADTSFCINADRTQLCSRQHTWC